MGKLLAALAGLALMALVRPAAAEETYTVLARVGPWPVASRVIGFGGRLWFVNSVKGRNHNSADIYSYDPASGETRYERHMFSQDAGAPAVFAGRLYWPFEDSRFSLGWGQILVTDGASWRMDTIPTARIFHVHALTAVSGQLVAATSAWRAGLQISNDEGASWRAVYDHPTDERRVSRIVELAAVGGDVYGTLIDSGRPTLVRFDGAKLAQVPAWPRGWAIRGLAVRGGQVYALVGENGGAALWRTNGAESERLGAPHPGWTARALAATRDGLWAASAEGGDGRLWHSRDGRTWRAVARLPGGTPWDITVYGGRVYVAGAGADGRGILWGPAAAPSDRRGRPLAPPSQAVPAAAAVDWTARGRELDTALADPASYETHARRLRDLVYAAVGAGAPDDFLAARLGYEAPDITLSMIGGAIQAPARDLGRWILLWGMALARQGRVPLTLLGAPWSAPPNPSEKYFETVPAALWAAAEAGQRDRATIGVLIARLDRLDDPPWLRGDVIGALTALTGQGFGYETSAWKTWWSGARAAWPG